MQVKNHYSLKEQVEHLISAFTLLDEVLDADQSVGYEDFTIFLKKENEGLPWNRTPELNADVQLETEPECVALESCAAFIAPRVPSDSVPSSKDLNIYCGERLELHSSIDMWLQL